MDLGLSGRTALVAGSTSGLGLATARALAAEGARVAICGRRADTARELAAELPGAAGFEVDLTEPGSAERLAAAVAGELGPVDVLVLNSGGPPPGPAAGLPADAVRTALETLLLRQVELVAAVLPGMRANGWGRIVAVGSSGVQQPLAGLALSNVARAGLAGYLKTLAGEVAPDGVTVNMVLPGRIATDRVASLDRGRAEREGADVADVEARSRATIPVGRYGRPEEFGAVAAFLCSDQASTSPGSRSAATVDSSAATEGGRRPMQLATASLGGDRTRAVLLDQRRGAAFADDLLDGSFADAYAVLTRHLPDQLAQRLAAAPDAVFRPLADVALTAPYRRPRLIWGIGLNYREHAADLSTTAPAEEPASFIKGDHTVIGPGEPIPLPWQSRRVTAEAELGLVIGRECRNVPESEAWDHVWGVVPVLDQTAEDILARNPRYLTRSKNFPGFFSFGPAITPTAEVFGRFGDVGRVEVATVCNGRVHRSNAVAAMMFSPAQLVSFHSQVMPLHPGDIISTGTPGAVQIQPGDLAECRIAGIGELSNPVVAGGPEPVDGGAGAGGLAPGSRAE